MMSFALFPVNNLQAVTPDTSCTAIKYRCGEEEGKMKKCSHFLHTDFLYLCKGGNVGSHSSVLRMSNLFVR